MRREHGIDGEFPWDDQVGIMPSSCCGKEFTTQSTVWLFGYDFSEDPYQLDFIVKKGVVCTRHKFYFCSLQNTFVLLS